MAIGFSGSNGGIKKSKKVKTIWFNQIIKQSQKTVDEIVNKPANHQTSKNCS